MKISSGDLPPLSRRRGQGEYTSLLHQELARNEAPVLDEHGRLPVVLPIVLYNGEAPWQSVLEVSELIQPVDKALAPYRPSQRYCVLDERHVGEDDLPSRNLVTTVALLERIRSPWDLIRVARMLRHWLRRPEDDELRRVFAAWVRETAEPLVPPWQALAPEMTLEDIEMTLVERVAEWAPPHPAVTPSSTRSMPRACDSRLWAGDDDVGGGGGGAQYGRTAPRETASPTVPREPPPVYRLPFVTGWRHIP